MALYDANRNTIKATNYPNHMQRPMMFDKEGGQQKIVGHFAAHNSERYVFSTHEEVVKFGRGDDRKPIPPIKNLYMDHGAGDKSPYTPRSSTEKSDSLSPKLQHPDVNSRSKGSLPPESSLKDKISPPPRNHHYYNTNDHGKYNYLSSNNDEKPKELSYDKEKNKRNGYAPPANYTIPYNLNNETPNSINNVYVPPKVKNIPQIKTRIGDPDFTNANPKKTTNYNASTKMGQDEEEMYYGIIDCIEAARKYNGVFVPK